MSVGIVVSGLQRDYETQPRTEKQTRRLTIIWTIWTNPGRGVTRLLVKKPHHSAGRRARRLLAIDLAPGIFGRSTIHHPPSTIHHPPSTIHDPHDRHLEHPDP